MTHTPTKPSAAERAAKLRHTFYNVMGRGSRVDAAMWLEQELTALIEKADACDAWREEALAAEQLNTGGSVQQTLAYSNARAARLAKGLT